MWCILPRAFNENCIIHFRFSLGVFLRVVVRRWVDPWKVLRQKSFWWWEHGVYYKRSTILWSRRPPDGWIPMDVISYLWTLVYVWLLMLVILIYQLLGFQFLSQVQIMLLLFFCWDSSVQYACNFSVQPNPQIMG